jgi:hypothetical protein
MRWTDVMKSSASCADASNELFVGVTKHVITNGLSSRDEVYQSLQKAANAVGVVGESEAAKFARAYSGAAPRISNELLPLFNRMEQQSVRKLGTGTKIPRGSEPQPGSETVNEPNLRPRYRMPRVSSSTDSPLRGGPNAGDEDPEGYMEDRLEQSDETTRSSDSHSRNAIDPGERFQQITDTIARAHPEISRSEAINRAMKEPHGREAYDASISKSLRANWPHG